MFVRSSPDRPWPAAGIQPLVDAVNQWFAPNLEPDGTPAHLLDDASHQLRTPLTTLHAQVGYALRQQDDAKVTSTLRSIHRHLEDATRNTNQLLTLARSDAAVVSWDDFDLHELLRDVAMRLLPFARAKALNFGVDVPEVACVCSGNRALLAEALTFRSSLHARTFA